VEVVFENLSSFVEQTKSLDVSKFSNLKETIDSYHEIPRGCQCKFESRKSHANNMYNQLFSKLTPDERALLNSFFKADLIIFKNENSSEIGRF
jgi:hypothetical protein